MISRYLSRLLLVALLASCTAGVVEFQYFRAAFETQYAEGTRVLDRLGAAERTVVGRQLARRSAVRDFDPDEARYDLNVGDPPLTAAIRASLDALRDYNASLSGLASGESAAALNARISTGVGALRSAVEAVGGAAGLDLGLSATLGSTLERVLPLYSQLARIGNRIEFRRQLLLAYPDMRALMLELRGGTRDMFTLIKRSYVTRGSLGGGGIDGISPGNLVKLDEDRKMLSAWVILIDKTLVAMDAAVLAMAEGGGSGDLAGLVEATVEVRALADTIKALRTSQN